MLLGPEPCVVLNQKENDQSALPKSTIEGRTSLLILLELKFKALLQLAG